MLRALRRELGRHLDLVVLFLIGVLLRVQYAVTTPFTVRSYDAAGHLQYIAYVATHFAVPVDSLGWEMHQPPLYYFLAAAIAKADTWMGRGALALGDIRSFSLFLSVLTLAAAAWVAMILFPKKQQSLSMLLFAGIIAALPGIVFTASRISNDTLAILVQFVFSALLLRWWKSPSRRDWLLLSIVAALGVLTKITVYFALPIALLCLVMKKRITKRERWNLGLTSLLLLAMISGWFLALRFSGAYFPQLFRYGTSLGLNPHELLPLRAGDLVSFSPVRMLEIPFNNPWNPTFGGRFFWEFLFRSAFFGEWQFWRLTVLARFLLLGGVGLFALAALGVVHDFRARGTFRIPLLLLFLGALVTLLLGRVVHQSVPNQDFRLTPVILLPFAAYVCYGIGALSARLRAWAVAWIVIFLILCCAFVFAVPFFS